MLFGALEAGGTKMVMAVGDETGRILEQETIPTSTPEETMPQIVEYFKEKIEEKGIVALGVGAFGPVDVVKGSSTYGYILNTPKLAWKNYNLAGSLEKELGIPVGLDTVVYITIGTGIGAGIAVGGKLLHGMLHPEAGHMLISKNSHDPGKSVCPYHESCFEGLASGPSIEARWGKKAIELVDKSIVWELESEYIAKGLVNMILTLSPQKVILGGGVMHQEQLFPMIREKVTTMLNAYYTTTELENMDNYIVPASLQDNQGIMGAIRLAQLAYEEVMTV